MLRNGISDGFEVLCSLMSIDFIDIVNYQCLLKEDYISLSFSDEVIPAGFHTFKCSLHHHQ